MECRGDVANGGLKAGVNEKDVIRAVVRGEGRNFERHVPEEGYGVFWGGSHIAEGLQERVVVSWYGRGEKRVECFFGDREAARIEYGRRKGDLFLVRAGG